MGLITHDDCKLIHKLNKSIFQLQSLCVILLEESPFRDLWRIFTEFRLLGNFSNKTVMSS